MSRRVLVVDEGFSPIGSLEVKDDYFDACVSVRRSIRTTKKGLRCLDMRKAFTASLGNVLVVERRDIPWLGVFPDFEQEPVELAVTE